MLLYELWWQVAIDIPVILFMNCKTIKVQYLIVQSKRNIFKIVYNKVIKF